MSRTGTDVFLATLQACGIAHEVHADGIRVPGDLDLSGTEIPALPDGLRVQGDLILSSTPVTCVPPGLTLGGSLHADSSQLSSLPERFRVSGSLYVHHTPLDTLPEGLVVERNLNISGTCIRRLPQTLSVGGWIMPPVGLQDIADFMAAHGQDECRLRRPQTHHESLALRSRLQGYRDLWQVLTALPGAQEMRILKSYEDPGSWDLIFPLQGF